MFKQPESICRHAFSSLATTRIFPVLSSAAAWTLSFEASVSNFTHSARFFCLNNAERPFVRTHSTLVSTLAEHTERILVNETSAKSVWIVLISPMASFILSPKCFAATKTTYRLPSTLLLIGAFPPPVWFNLTSVNSLLLSFPSDVVVSSTLVMLQLFCKILLKYSGPIPSAFPNRLWFTALCATTSKLSIDFDSSNTNGKMYSFQHLSPLSHNSTTGKCPLTSNFSGAVFHCAYAFANSLFSIVSLSFLSNPWNAYKSISRKSSIVSIFSLFLSSPHMTSAVLYALCNGLLKQWSNFSLRNNSYDRLACVSPNSVNTLSSEDPWMIPLSFHVDWPWRTNTTDFDLTMDLMLLLLLSSLREATQEKRGEALMLFSFHLMLFL